jgi:type I restriction enzyme S subunit
MLPFFFLHWLKSGGGRARFMQKTGRTAVQFNVNAEQIADIDIPLPPLSLQEDFASVVARVESLRGGWGE